jgi:hypothetical protein
MGFGASLDITGNEQRAEAAEKGQLLAIPDLQGGGNSIPRVGSLNIRVYDVFGGFRISLP